MQTFNHALRDHDQHHRQNSKDPFEKLYATIDKQVPDATSKEKITKIVDDFARTYHDLNGKIASVNSKENDILIKQNASQAELQGIADDINAIRLQAYTSLVDFHFDMLEAVPEANWDKIMKEFNKILK